MDQIVTITSFTVCKHDPQTDAALLPMPQVVYFYIYVQFLFKFIWLLISTDNLQESNIEKRFKHIFTTCLTENFPLGSNGKRKFGLSIPLTDCNTNDSIMIK